MRIDSIALSHGAGNRTLFSRAGCLRASVNTVPTPTNRSRRAGAPRETTSLSVPGRLGARRRARIRAQVTGERGELALPAARWPFL